jgi:broad specificity phosphatase PhoE
VNACLGVPVEKDPVWAERHLGELTGLDHETASREVPPPPFLNIYEPYGETGEGQWRLFLRAGRGLQSLLERPAGNYLVVGHRAILGMTMCAMFGITPQANFHGPRFQFENTGSATLTYDPGKHQWRLHSFNDMRHLLGIQVPSLQEQEAVAAE